jgi:uncharacterized membrane protein (GlpM family)
METLAVLAVKAVAGGTLVVVFAVLGERLRPQSLAGILAAAPSVALASLAVVLVAKGSSQVVDNAEGMLIGAAALVIAALVAVDAVRRFRALRGSLVSIAAWLTAAGALYGVILR